MLLLLTMMELGFPWEIVYTRGQSPRLVRSSATSISAPK